MKIIIEIKKITIDWRSSKLSRRTIKMVHFHKALTKSQIPLTNDSVLNLTNLIFFFILVRFYVYRVEITVSVNVK